MKIIQSSSSNNNKHTHTKEKKCLANLLYKLLIFKVFLLMLAKNTMLDKKISLTIEKYVQYINVLIN